MADCGIKITPSILAKTKMLIYHSKANLDAKIFALVKSLIFLTQKLEKLGERSSGLNSFRQVPEVKLGRVRSNSGWVTSEA